MKGLVHKMRVAILGARMGIGAGQPGAEEGPQAIRNAALVQRLKALGHEVEDFGNVTARKPLLAGPGDPKLRYVGSITSTAEMLATRVATLGTERLPIVLGGDHSVSLGSVTGIARSRDQFGLLWVDAHGDFNTRETTPSGNIHGMVLAALAGIGDPRLTTIGGRCPKVEPARIAIVGARSVDHDTNADTDEYRLLHRSGVHVYTMRDVDQNGIRAVVEEAIAQITQGSVPLHVSWDIDVLDPSEAPGTGTLAPGGLTYRESRTLMETLYATGAMCSLDMVEVNPRLDLRGRTSELAAELICTALGKRLF